MPGTLLSSVSAIADGQFVGAVKADAEALEEGEVGMVAGHGEDEVVMDGQAAIGSFEQEGVRSDFDDIGVEESLDFAVFDAVFDVGLDPVFDVRCNSGPR